MQQPIASPAARSSPPAEEMVGKATDDDQKIAEGKAKQVKGDAKQAAEKIKDAGKNLGD